MSTGVPRGIGGAPNVLLGVLRLARGRADGLSQFGSSSHAFLTSLAPLVAFPLVGSALMLFDGGGLGAVADLLATLCALLAPAVISWSLARRWRRETLWLRFATAFNWCQWAIPAVATFLLLALGMLMSAGMPNRMAGLLGILGLVGYGLWLHWFLARRGLELSVPRSILLVLCVNFGTALVVVLPRLAEMAISPDLG